MATTGSGDSGGVEIHPLDRDGVGRARQMLQLAEKVLGVPLVDESETIRLERAADGETIPRWSPLLALRDGVAAGYGAVVTPPEGDPEDDHDRDPGRSAAATGDVAVAPAALDRTTVLTVLLEALSERAQEAEADSLAVWVRHVDAQDLAAAERVGFPPQRRLAILGRALEGLPAVPPPPEGIRIRPSEPQIDDEALAAVLAAAYAGTDDGGWDVERVRGRTELPWYRPEDVLLAEDEDGQVLGVHWLKRRSATEGEVYNLAVHPDGQGRRLGVSLLHAGLTHLAEAGCEEVILWVDRVNERAVDLYTSQGFTTRWEDVALGRRFSRPDQP